LEVHVHRCPPLSTSIVVAARGASAVAKLG